MDGATAPILKINYNYSKLIICFNIISGRPIRYIENIPEVIYYMLGYDTNEEISITVNKINQNMKKATNIQITELEFIEMQDRLNADPYYYNECINHSRKNIDFIV